MYWCCAQIEPCRERLASHCLHLAGYRIYQPLLREQRRSHGRKIIVTPPLEIGGAVSLVTALSLLGSLLLSSTVLGGAAGASIRMVFERRYGSGPLVPPSMPITFALGGMAGALAGLLYLVAQPGDLKMVGDPGLRLAASLAVVSTIAGLTAETIFRKLLGIDVLQTRSIVASGTPSSGTPKS